MNKFRRRSFLTGAATALISVLYKTVCNGFETRKSIELPSEKRDLASDLAIKINGETSGSSNIHFSRIIFDKRKLYDEKGSGVLLNVSGKANELSSEGHTNGSALITSEGNINWKPIIIEVETIDDLRKEMPTLSRSVIALGYYSKGDGGGGEFYSVCGNTPGTYVDNGGTIIVPGHGDGSSAWLRILSSKISVKIFGASDNMNFDNTLYIQNAINYALEKSLPLHIDGKFYIKSSLFINRKVDFTTDIFVIYAEGNGNGIYASSGITMFDASLQNKNHLNPLSEFITFLGVHFEATGNTHNSYVISDKFLRIRFEHCNFRGIKCLNSSAYVQTWYFNGCNIRGWSNGHFFSSNGGAYDICLTNNIVERSNGGFIKLYDKSEKNPVAGIRIHSNLIEGINGSAIELGGTRGCIITGNYFESVGAKNIPSINLDINSSPQIGLVISGNFIVNHPTDRERWAIKWGRAHLAVTKNNYCGGNFHDNSCEYLKYGQWGVSSVGDWASGILWKIPRGNILSNMIAHPYISITQAGGIFNLNTENYSIFKLITTESKFNSCNYPTGGVVGQRINIQICNNSSNPIDIWKFIGSWTVSSWTPLAAGHYRSKDFYFDGISWKELTSLDVI